MSLLSLSAEIYGHGRIMQISPRPGRFASIGSAFPTTGETVEDTRTNIEYVRQETRRWSASIAYLDGEVFERLERGNGYFCRLETYDFAMDCLRENAKLEDVATINSTLRAFLQPLAECVGFIVRDSDDFEDLMRHTFEALSSICYTILALKAVEGVDPGKVDLIQASIDSAAMFVDLYNSRIRSERLSWKTAHSFSWFRRKLQADAKGTLLAIGFPDAYRPL